MVGAYHHVWGRTAVGQADLNKFAAWTSNYGGRGLLQSTLVFAATVRSIDVIKGYVPCSNAVQVLKPAQKTGTIIEFLIETCKLNGIEFHGCITCPNRHLQVAYADWDITIDVKLKPCDWRTARGKIKI